MTYLFAVKGMALKQVYVMIVVTVDYTNNRIKMNNLIGILHRGTTIGGCVHKNNCICTVKNRKYDNRSAKMFWSD